MSTPPPTKPNAPVAFPAAPFDAYSERITSGFAMLGGVLMLPALFWYLSGLHFSSFVLIPVAIAAALAVYLAFAYAFQPTSYQIEAARLVVRRRWTRAMRVPLKEITGVSVARNLADVPRTGLRRSFNAGVFGYQGPFQLDPFGTVFFTATNRERLVAIARLSAPPLIISPARAADFVDALREALLKRDPNA